MTVTKSYPYVLFLTSLSILTASESAAVEGFAEPFREVVVSAASEPDRVTSRNVDEGTTVTKGQLLATLDTNVLRASLEIAKKRATMKGRIMAAKAELRIRQRRLEKLGTLKAQGHATQAELDRAELDLATSEASLLRVHEELELNELEITRIEAEIDQRMIRSPINGVVSEVHREVGEVTQIGDPRLLTVVQLNPLKVKFSMTVSQTTGIHIGDILPITIAEAGEETEAKVEAIAPVLDATSGTVKVTCVFDNSKAKYRSGMRCLLNISDVNKVSGDVDTNYTVPVSRQKR
jgi:RND family efflux transporter MFP subunit